jgi:hypothetical protein
MKTFLIIISLALSLTMSAVMAHADLMNSRFEIGDFSRWTISGDIEGITIVTLEGKNIASFSNTNVLIYIAGLIEWGDTLFGQSTSESVNESPSGYGYVQIVGVTLNGDIVDTYVMTRDAVRNGDWEYWQWTATEPGYYEVKLGFVTNNSSSPTHFLFDGVQLRPVPIPSALLLLGSGLLGLAGWRRFRKS